MRELNYIRNTYKHHNKTKIIEISYSKTVMREKEIGNRSMNYDYTKSETICSHECFVDKNDSYRCDYIEHPWSKIKRNLPLTLGSRSHIENWLSYLHEKHVIRSLTNSNKKSSLLLKNHLKIFKKIRENNLRLFQFNSISNQSWIQQLQISPHRCTRILNLHPKIIKKNKKWIIIDTTTTKITYSRRNHWNPENTIPKLA